MNRRGFFGRVLGAMAAATVAKSLPKTPVQETKTKAMNELNRFLNLGKSNSYRCSYYATFKAEGDIVLGSFVKVSAEGCVRRTTRDDPYCIGVAINVQHDFVHGRVAVVGCQLRHCLV